MHRADIKRSNAAQNQIQKKRQPFFSKEGQGGFFSNSAEKSDSFFSSTTLQPKLNLGQPNDKYEVEAEAMADRLTSIGDSNGEVVQSKCTECEEEENIVQRQEEEDFSITNSPETEEASSQNPGHGSPRANRCLENPRFPDFPCLAYALKLDIDENLQNNAHQFYRIASLYPQDSELMFNTFMRYGLGANLLTTSFRFMGANETLGTILTYGTGIGLKSYDFFQDGRLQLDVPIPLGRGVNLDFQLDLNANPDNLTEIRDVSAGVGVSGHF